MDLSRRLLSLLLALLLAAPATVEARNRKGDKLLKEGQQAEQKKNYDEALVLYEKAVLEDPSETAYQLALRRVRFQAAQAHVDRGKQLRDAGNLEEALKEYQHAYAIDPSSMIAEQELRRTFQMMERNKKLSAETGRELTPKEQGMTPSQVADAKLEERISEYQSVPELRPITPQITSLKMNNQPPRVLFETVAKLAGINVIFDPDFIQQNTRPFNLDLSNTTLEQALDHLAVLTNAFWKPLSANTIFVTLNNPTKRRDYEDQVVKVFYLQNVTTVQELQEIAVAVRSVLELRRAFTYNAQNAILIRAEADRIALAEKLLRDLDKPKSEVVVDLVVLEANRTKTRDLAAALQSAGGAIGLRAPVSFTPRNPVLSGGGDGNGDDNGNDDGGSGNNGNTNTNTNTGGLGGIFGSSGTGNTAREQAISLARIGRISTNDFSITLPGALFQAMLSDRSTRVIQSPQVRSIDNAKAELHIGDKYPYATGSFQPGIGTVGVSPLVSTQFQFADVGVKLVMTPKVHGSDEVSLHVEMEISSVRDRIDVGGLSQPVIGQRRVVHDIRVKEGQVTLLGGLMQNQDTNSVSGLPGIASLPGLKWLFGSESVEKNQGELLIALIPHIVRSQELSENNLRGISSGTEMNYKVTYSSTPEKPTAAVEAPKPEAPPAAVAPGVVPEVKPEAPPVETPEPETPAAPAAPAATALSFNPPAVEARLGAEIPVSVQIQNVTDLFSAPIRLRFDSKRLRLNEVTRGTLLSGDGQNVVFTRNIQNDVGELTVNLNRLPGSAGVSGSGTLLNLTFQAIGVGQAQVTVVDGGLRNSQMLSIQAGNPILVINVKQE
ncbi:MAG: hypothetical protein HUU41_02880 [Bryobacteraceae bacterium]|nr:hypothetical protein [Bryobacterales bacterium]MEB2362148.1 cohesin domain-containing protein [Bryobacterales bacterium]NUN00035.1 hypothetical protein [Bryobacteraceae bacterium]